MVPADAPCALRCRFVRMGLRGVMRRWRIPMNGGRCGCAIRWVMADDVASQPGATIIQPLFGGFSPMAVYCADGAIRWVGQSDE